MMIVQKITAFSFLIILLCLIAFPHVPNDPKRISIWADLDRVFVRCSLGLATFLHAPVPAVNDAVANQAQAERIFAGRMAAAGLFLLAVLPFHRLFFTDGLIDAAWQPVYAISKWARESEFDNFVHIAGDWREEEYYLWEISAFLWTMIQLGSSQRREITKLLDAGLVSQKSAFSWGSNYVVLVLVMALAGVIVLLIAVSIYVLIFDAVVILVLTTMELWLVRILFRGGKADHAYRGVESALFIEVPAFLAFVLAALFVGSADGFSSYSSHWSHSFASGAAALALVLANVGLLLIRTLQRPPETTLKPPHETLLLRAPETPLHE